MYLCRERLKCSLPELGAAECFGPLAAAPSPDFSPALRAGEKPRSSFVSRGFAPSAASPRRPPPKLASRGRAAHGALKQQLFADLHSDV